MGAMEVVRLREGLWQWGCPHPASPERAEPEDMVWSTYVECDDATVVIDPVVPDDPDDAPRFWRALDRDVERRGLPVRVLLTCDRHVRSAADIAARYDAPVFGPDPAGVGGREPAALLGVGSPAVGITVMALDTAPTPEVAFRIGADVLVTGDAISVRDGRLVVAPTPARQLADGRQLDVTSPAHGVLDLLIPLPAIVLTGHGREDDSARIARFAASIQAAERR